MSFWTLFKRIRQTLRFYIIISMDLIADISKKSSLFCSQWLKESSRVSKFRWVLCRLLQHETPLVQFENPGAFCQLP